MSLIHEEVTTRFRCELEVNGEISGAFVCVRAKKFKEKSPKIERIDRIKGEKNEKRLI